MLDKTIADIHKTREHISDAFGGDIGAISEDARLRQEQSGRRTLSYAKPRETQGKLGGIEPTAGSELEGHSQ